MMEVMRVRRVGRPHFSRARAEGSCRPSITPVTDITSSLTPSNYATANANTPHSIAALAPVKSSAVLMRNLRLRKIK